MATIPVLAWMPGPTEMLFIAIFGLLIFGKRLPEVGKSLGKSIVEFKKGLHGIEDEINNSSGNSGSSPNRQQDILPPPRQNDDNTVQRTQVSQTTGQAS